MKKGVGSVNFLASTSGDAAKVSGLSRLAAHAVEVLDCGITCPIVLVCEHASHVVPEPWGQLGLSKELLMEHIGWDAGAGQVTRLLSFALGATAVLANYSRLFFDCNRDPTVAEAIPSISDNTVIPGNSAVDAAERALRRAIVFDPLHARITTVVDRHLHADVLPVLISIHSFTPVLAGVTRPWEIGILWNECDSLSDRILRALSKARFGGRPVVVGANQPYSSKQVRTYTSEQHGRRRNLPNAIVEIRNDLIRTREGQREISSILASALREAVDGLSA